MPEEHEQSLQQQEQSEHYECLWCGETFDSGKELRDHTCVGDHNEPASLSVQPNR